MFLGRGVLLGYLAKKKINKQKKDPQPKNFKLRDHQTKFNQAIKKQHYYFYKKYPWAGWFLGLVMISISQWINYVLITHRHIFLDDIEGLSYTTKFAISISITLVGLMFIACSEIVSLEINKRLSLLFLQKKTVFGRKTIISRNLKKLKSVTIIKRGHESIETNTIHYVIQLSFEQEKDIDILEQNNILEIRKKYVEIMTYLEKPIDFEGNFAIIDESTGKSQQQKNKNQQKNAKNKSQDKNVSSSSSLLNADNSQSQNSTNLMIDKYEKNSSIIQADDKQQDIIQKNKNEDNEIDFSFQNAYNKIKKQKQDDQLIQRIQSQ